jgi:hypothetical protein
MRYELVDISSSPPPPRAKTSPNIELSVENKAKNLLMTNTARIFMKIAAAQGHYIEITYTKFHETSSKKYGKYGYKFICSGKVVFCSFLRI